MESKLSYGQRACGVSFNPGGHPAVAAVKQQFADLVDTLHAGREAATDPEVKRMFSIAITETQSAQMWAIKAITWSI
jgi:hypothetical protein